MVFLTMEPSQEPYFQAEKINLMLKFRALCGFMYGWVGNRKKFMGTLRTWLEQKDFFGLLMRTRRIWEELFENLMEQKVFDGLLVGTKRIWQEQFGNNANLMGV